MEAAGFPRLPVNFEAVKRMTTKSVMSPMLWLIGITFPLLLVGAYFFTGWMQELFAGLAALEVVAGLLFYTFFAIRSPQLLQSEEYRIEEQRITLLAEQGKPPVTLDLKAEQVSNTYLSAKDGANGNPAGASL